MSAIDYTEKMKKLGPLPEDMRIFWVGENVARIEARMPYCLQCINEGREIVAALEDFAQIIGPRVRIVDEDDLDIAKALTTSAAVLVRVDEKLTVDTSQAVTADGSIVIAPVDNAIQAASLPLSGRPRDGKARREQDYVVTTGRDPYEAYVALTVLEKAAEVQILADALGGVRPIPERTARKLRQNYLSKYSKAGRKRRDQEFIESGESDYINDGIESKEIAQEVTEDLEAAESNKASIDASLDAEFLLEEFKQRGSMVSFGKKLIEKKMVQGTWGNLSVRLDGSEEDYMLVTPTGLDYDSLGPEDMVKVEIETGRYERRDSDGNKKPNKPTTEMNLHAGIYKSRPDVGAIIHTHSKYCSVFAACNMPLEVIDTYLAEEVAADIVHIADYAPSGSDELNANVVKALGGYIKDEDMESVDELHAVFTGMFYGRKGCLIANHGMVAVAADLDGALEVAEAMEEAARKLINQRLTRLVEKKEGRS